MKNSTLTKYTMTYGLYLGIAFSAVVYIMHLAGKIHYPGDTASSFNTFLLMGGTVIFGRKYRDNFSDNNFYYKNAFGFSMLMALFSAIIYSFFCYFYYANINTEAISFYINKIQTDLTNSAIYSEEQTQAIVQLYKSYLEPKSMTFTVFMIQMFAGVFVSLIASVLIKKNTNN